MQPHMTKNYALKESENQSLNSIHPGGVNICEHLELLGETDREERVKSPSHTDGLFRATCLSMSHLQCDIRVWPDLIFASVSLSISMRANPELQRMYAVKARPLTLSLLDKPVFISGRTASARRWDREDTDQE